MIRDYRKSDQAGAWDPDEVAAYLRAGGFLIGPQGYGTALDPDDPATVLVRVDLDANVPQKAIDAYLDGFVPREDPAASAQVTMRKAVAQVKAATAKTPIEDRVAALERAVIADAQTRGVG